MQERSGRCPDEFRFKSFNDSLAYLFLLKLMSIFGDSRRTSGCLRESMLSAVTLSDRKLIFFIQV